MITYKDNIIRFIDEDGQLERMNYRHRKVLNKNYEILSASAGNLRKGMFTTFLRGRCSDGCCWFKFVRVS